MSDNLTRLKGAERIRKRAGVMLGSDDIRGVQQTLFEIVSNSIDRYKKGFGNYVKIIKHSDLSYTVIDEADGLPMDWNEKENAYNWDLALKVLYAGDSYTDKKEEIGNNGLGLVSTQYSSEFMDVIVHKGNKIFTVKCKEGRPIHKITGEFIKEDSDDLFTREEGKLVLLVENNDSDRTGTYTHWKPDAKVFSNIDIDIEWIKDKIRKQAVVNKGLKLDVIDEANDVTYTYFYENGLTDYLKEISNESNLSDIVIFEDNGVGRESDDRDEYTARYEFALTFNNEINKVEYYHNSSELLQGGCTKEAIENALEYTIHEYASNNNLYTKNEKKIKYSDIEDSLICVISSFSSYTSYANQNKLSVDNKFLKEFITNSLKEKLKIYFIENKLEADRIVNQVLINHRANEKASQTKLDLKKKLQSNTKSSLSTKIEGVKHCDMRNSNVEERIFIVDEGVSANSTIVEAIDSRIMGCCGLRGRFINSLKSSVADVLDNEPALKIIKALGCGIEIPYNERKKYKDIDSFDINNLNYGSIGILCDSDAFGKGITLSLVTFFYKYFPTLLKQNRVFIVISPRYEITTKDETIFVYNDKEKEEVIKKLEKQNKSYSIGVKKGLGEFNRDDFWTYVLSDEARKNTFIPVEYVGTEEDIKYYFDMLMGDNIDERKNFIRKNITNIDLNNIE